MYVYSDDRNSLFPFLVLFALSWCLFWPGPLHDGVTRSELFKKPLSAGWNSRINFIACSSLCYWTTEVQVSDTQWGQTMLKHCSLEDRFIARPCKLMSGSRSKKPQNYWKLSSKPFEKQKRWGRDEVSCCKSPGLDPLFLRSGHGQVTMFL